MRNFSGCSLRGMASACSCSMHHMMQDVNHNDYYLRRLHWAIYK